MRRRPVHAACALAMLVAGTIVGCATVPPPRAKQAAARAAIEAAHRARAWNLPAAGLHMRLAIDQFAAAQRLVREDDDLERAAFLFERAQADAELASALVRREAARLDVREALTRAHRGAERRASRDTVWGTR